MNTGARRRPAGFTLLEIMVALALLGLIVTAVYSSWMAIVRGSRVGLNAAAAAQRSRLAVQTLEEALTAARSFAGDARYYGFVAENGSDASLSFVARLSDSFPRGGRFGDFNVRRVTFSLESTPESGKELVLRQNPILMDMDIDEKEHPVVLARNVKSFEMEFLSERSPEWQDEWLETNQLPAMVKVTLRLTAEGSSQVTKEVTREIALPAITVLPEWQTGRR